MLDTQRSKSVRSAVEVMRVWLDTPDGPPDRLIESLRVQVDEHQTRDNRSAATELIMGLITLNGSLLLLRELEIGARAGETLRDVVTGYAQDTEVPGS